MEHQATRGRLVPDAELRRFDAVVPTPFGGVGIRTEGSAPRTSASPRSLSPAGVPGSPRRTGWRPRRARRSGATSPIRRRRSSCRSSRSARATAPRLGEDRRDPRGRVRSYGEVATDIRSGPRAVGQACGANSSRSRSLPPCRRLGRDRRLRPQRRRLPTPDQAVAARPRGDTAPAEPASRPRGRTRSA